MAAERDPVFVALAWWGIANVTLLAIVCSFAWPLVYLSAMGLAGCVLVGLGTVSVLVSMPPLVLLWCAGDVLKAGLYAIGAILSGLGESSK